MLRDGIWHDWGSGATKAICNSLVSPLLLAHPNLKYRIIRISDYLPPRVVQT